MDAPWSLQVIGIALFGLIVLVVVLRNLRMPRSFDQNEISRSDLRKKSLSRGNG